nr:MAG TPA: Replication initiation factor [Inoviridae sp.]
MCPYVIRLDYATFAFTRDSVNLGKIQQCLSGGVDLGFRQFGTSVHSPFQSPYGLYYKPECGSNENPHVLQVSGVGCEHFREVLPCLAKVLRDGGEQAHFRRIDICFDVVMKRSEWRSYLAKCFAFSMENQRQRKKFLLHGSGEAMTVYIGSRNSDRYFRIYNKSLQSPSYEFVSWDGTISPVADDEWVIRYEIESSYKNRWRSGQKLVFDPSVLFDWYYSNSVFLSDYVRESWLSFGSDVLLPDDFENAEFVTDICVRNLHPVDVIASPYSDVVFANVSARKDCAPYCFDKSLEYASSHYGAYVPYILRDERLIAICCDAAREKFGLDIGFSVYFHDQALDEFEELPDDSYSPWSDDGEFEEIDILKGKELRTYADFGCR